MICRQCGTEIADKAIVCYRCGTATTDPVRRPVQVRRKGTRLPALVGLIALVVLGLYLGEAGRTAPAHATAFDTAAGICLAAVAVLLIVRIVRRR
ncbi:MAG TPA: hypothetical protein VGL62_07280 [Vicinamibacterales bacterium]|jgi:hypothetical protein